MWKLKIDENGNVVIKDGKPVYIKDDGSEIAIDINQTNQTISRLNAEAKSHREAKETAEAELKKFEGLEPEAAREAIETTKKIDQKKLIDAGKVDEVRAEVTKSYDAKLAEQKKLYDDINTRYEHTVRSNAFTRSKFITDKIAVPPDMIEAAFGNHFKIEADGSLRAYVNGQPIYSPDRPGEIATFDEALSELVKQYPHRDQILKGGGHSGSGSLPSGGGGGRATYTRADYVKMSPADQARIAGEAREGKAEIVDS
jgi:hypothetical protein